MTFLSTSRPMVVACVAVFPLLATAAEHGFIEDSELTLSTRSVILNNQIKGDGHDRRPHNRRDPRDVSLGLKANFASGFTQGTLGLGVDAFAYSGFKLDGGDGHAGYGTVQMNKDGEAQRSFGRAGALIKARYAQSQLRYGQMQVTNPVFATSDTRVFPSTATGFLLSSQDITGLLLEGGHFTAGTEPSSTSSKGGLWANYANIETRAVDFAGGRYALNDHWSMSAYGADFEDLWHQYYLGSTYSWTLDPASRIDLDVNGYRTNDAGQALAGDIDTTAFSTQVAYTWLNHKVSLGFQRIIGDTPFDYIGFGNNGSGAFGNSIYLSNPVMASDFNGPNEKSWQLRYDLDMTPYGVPGLSFMGRYVYGYDISTSPNPNYQAWSAADDAQHQELDLEARYVVQSGSAKGMKVRLREGHHNAVRGQPDGDISMHMVIVEWPLRLF